MNPFRALSVKKKSAEKTDFLKNLTLLIWKGTQGEITKTEDRLIDQVITEYYDVYFNGFNGFTPPKEDLRQSLLIDDRSNNRGTKETDKEREERINKEIDEIESRRKDLKVETLSFNTSYEYSVQRIPDICHENNLSGVDISTYRYMMKDFYR